MAILQNSRTELTRARREKVAHIRLSPEEFAAIEAAAVRAELTISGFVRSLTLEGAGVQPCLTEAERAVFGLLLADMRTIGGNLNQVARTLNGGRMVADPDLDASIRDVRALVIALSNELKGLTIRSGSSRRGEAA